MRHFLSFSLVLACITFTSLSKAQYCTPAITTGGIFISYAGFGSPYTAIPGGINYPSSSPLSSEGYINRSGSSSGTITRSCSHNIFFSFQNCGNAGNKDFNFRVYADWNQDNDFNDDGETAIELTDVLSNGNCGFNNPNVTLSVPARAPAGSIRIRCALREGGGIADACGGYKGEIEDYTLIIADNNAPVLSNNGLPVLNPLIETQADNTGITISRLIQSTSPVELITEPDPCVNVKGIALTSANGPGVWQYNIGAGWTTVLPVSMGNALLLSETDRVRFVPYGTGAASITFLAWDQTTGMRGENADITETGGSTSFSETAETASLQVYAASSASHDVTVYMPTLNTPGTEYNVMTVAFSPSTGLLKHTNYLTTDNTSGNGSHITMDVANQKLYWIGGNNGTDVMRCNMDGTGIETLITGVFSWPGGIAIGNNKIFITEYDVGVFSANTDGSNLTQIITYSGGGDPGDLGDIEYYNDRIYYIHRPNYIGDFKIFEANPDGSNVTEIRSIVNYPQGMDIINGKMYWTETDFSSSFIYSAPVGTGAATQLATEAGRSWLDLFANPGTNKIYFSDYSIATGGDPWIKSIPLNGGAVAKELMMENSVSSLVFNRTGIGTLPVHFISVKAWPQGTRHRIECHVGEEENVHHYTLQRSADGRVFSDIATVTATQQGRYEWTDMQPLPANNYYRIMATDNDGKKTYSAIMMLGQGPVRQSMSVYPTVVVNGLLNISLQQLAPGEYTLEFVTNTGGSVYEQKIIHRGGTSVQVINVPASLAKGIYRVVLRNNNELFTGNLVIP